MESAQNETSANILLRRSTSIFLWLHNGILNRPFMNIKSAVGECQIGQESRLILAISHKFPLSLKYA